MDDFTFENDPYLQYEGGATFIRRCEKCLRFVKADESVLVNDRAAFNASCSKCGWTKMLFIGYCE